MKFRGYYITCRMGRIIKEVYAVGLRWDIDNVGLCEHGVLTDANGKVKCD